jgi:hypothetical protein
MVMSKLPRNESLSKETRMASSLAKAYPRPAVTRISSSRPTRSLAVRASDRIRGGRVTQYYIAVLLERLILLVVVLSIEDRLLKRGCRKSLQRNFRNWNKIVHVHLATQTRHFLELLLAYGISLPGN